MNMRTNVADKSCIVYPDSDGQPMAENTLQFRWIVTLQGNLDALFRDDANVFVAGDLLWYPVEGEPTIRAAPDAMVAFGRPKGYRGSYMQWREGGVAPQVAFEVQSPGNRAEDLGRKFAFYDHHGVEEYYLYDPDHNRLSCWRRVGGALETIPEMNGWVSPRLGIRFDLSGPELQIFHPDGRRFLTYLELAAQRDELAAQRAELAAERDRAQQEHERERQARALAEQQARQAAEQVARLAEKLRALGVDPDAG